MWRRRCRLAARLAYAALRGRTVDVRMVDPTGEWHIIGMEVTEET